MSGGRLLPAPMEHPNRSGQAGLPYDSILEILARLPARSVYRSKCVAKEWRDLVDDPLNRKKLPQTLEGFFLMKPGTVHVGLGAEHFGFINLLPRPVPLDIDPCFSFLKKLPGTELSFLDSCNGLLLFVNAWNPLPLHPYVLGYVVCNPATKQWESVPPCRCCLPMRDCAEWYTFLAFHPAVSSHFHLIHFCRECRESSDEEAEELEDEPLSVCAYSSGTRTWSRRSQTDRNNEQGHLEGWRHQGAVVCYPGVMPQRTFVNGILHLMVWELDHSPIVAAVDIQGKTQRIIKMPAAAEGMRWAHAHSGNISQSQGRLHYINFEVEVGDTDDPEKCYEWSIWVLQDYDTQEWVLKDVVSFLKLLGTDGKLDYFVIAMHQDCNVVFFLQSLNRLIAYDMDRKEVTVVATFENEIWVGGIAPYVPYFAELPVLTNKH